MNKTRRHYSDIEDLITSLSPKQQAEIAEAEKEIDLAVQLYQARTERGLTQAEAGARAGMKQQMVSKLERVGANVEISTVEHYLNALGYRLKLIVEDKQTGEPLDTHGLITA